MAPLFQQPFMSGGFPSMNRAVASPWDFEDDFSTSTNWTQTGTDATIGSGVANLNGVEYPEGDRLTHDLGSTISDTAWIHQWKWNATTLTGGVNHFQFFLSDADITGALGSSYDFVSVSELNGKLYLRWSDHASTGESTLISVSTGTDYWLRLTRNTATSTTVNAYSDEYSSHLTNSPYTKSNLPSTVVSLRYSVLGFFGGSAISRNDNFDDYKFADGVTTPP